MTACDLWQALTTRGGTPPIERMCSVILENPLRHDCASRLGSRGVSGKVIARSWGDHERLRGRGGYEGRRRHEVGAFQLQNPVASLGGREGAIERRLVDLMEPPAGIEPATC